MPEEVFHRKNCYCTIYEFPKIKFTKKKLLLYARSEEWVF